MLRLLGRLPEIVAFSSEGAKHPLAAEIIAATEAAGGDAVETTPDILSKMSGKLVASHRSPSETDPSWVSSIRLGVTKENAGSVS